MWVLIEIWSKMNNTKQTLALVISFTGLYFCTTERKKMPYKNDVEPFHDRELERPLKKSLWWLECPKTCLKMS